MAISLVTGGAGFIGSHVVDELLQMGHEVVALDDLSGGFIENVNKGANFVQGSILDHALIDALFQKHRFDYVYHLAAYAAEGLSPFIKRFNYTNNLIGSINLVNASVNTGSVKCFVFTSSIAVYGSNQLPMVESLHPMPEDPYGIAKFAVEKDLEASHEMWGLPYIIFRPHNVYGERQNVGDRYRNVIGIFMNKIMRNEPLTVFGDGKQTRAFSHIADVAPVIAHSVENTDAYCEIFNVGADTPYTINQLIEVISKAMDVSPDVRFGPSRNEVTHAYSSHEKVKEYFGQHIKDIPLKQGIQEMTAWVLDHGSRESRKFSGIEVTKNMPPFWVS